MVAASYATLRSRMRERLDFRRSGTTTAPFQTSLCALQKTLIFEGFAQTPWASILRPIAENGENFAKFSLSFSVALDFRIFKSKRWFCDFFADQRVTLGLGRAVL
jgi:hypothetical protein